MTTPINTFQDILNAMEREPALRDALRRHILDEEFLQMPARLIKIEADIEELKAGQARLESNVSTLKEDVSTLKEDMTTVKEDVSTLKEDMTAVKQEVATMGGNVSRLAGTDYETRATGLARRHIFREMGIPGALVFSTAKNPERLRALADEAIEARILDDRNADDMERADIVLTASQPDGTAVYLLGEISITANKDDVEKARRRAALLATATGIKCLPIVLAEEAEEGLETGGVTLMLTQQHQEP